MRGHNVLMQSARTEAGREAGSRDTWRTPEYVLRCVREALDGVIDLDPCADGDLANWIARTNYSGPLFGEERRTEKGADGALVEIVTPRYGNGHDGLADDWRVSTVFVNFPYSQALAWCQKLVSEYEQDSFEQAIVLLPSRTETVAWQLATKHASAVCFVCRPTSRVRFVDGPSTAPFPSALVYLGDTPGRFAKAMLPLGPSWKPLHVGDWP